MLTPNEQILTQATTVFFIQQADSLEKRKAKHSIQKNLIDL